jgi:hypothetical protein
VCVWYFERPTSRRCVPISHFPPRQHRWTRPVEVAGQTLTTLSTQVTNPLDQAPTLLPTATWPRGCCMIEHSRRGRSSLSPIGRHPVSHRFARHEPKSAFKLFPANTLHSHPCLGTRVRHGLSIDRPVPECRTSATNHHARAYCPHEDRNHLHRQ